MEKKYNKGGCRRKYSVVGHGYLYNNSNKRIYAVILRRDDGKEFYTPAEKDYCPFPLFSKNLQKRYKIENRRKISLYNIKSLEQITYFLSKQLEKKYLFEFNIKMLFEN